MFYWSLLPKFIEKSYSATHQDLCMCVTPPGQTKNDTDLKFGTHTPIDLIWKRVFCFFLKQWPWGPLASKNCRVTWILRITPRLPCLQVFWFLKWKFIYILQNVLFHSLTSIVCNKIFSPLFNQHKYDILIIFVIHGKL